MHWSSGSGTSHRPFTVTKRCKGFRRKPMDTFFKAFLCHLSEALLSLLRGVPGCLLICDKGSMCLGAAAREEWRSHCGG